MSEGAMRAAIGVAGLLVGVAVGWQLAVARAGRGSTRDLPIGDRFVVVVGPTAADVHPPKTRLKEGQEIRWIAVGPDRDLVIESEEQLFEQQSQQANGRWAMTCSGPVCDSNAMLRDAADGEYKYWQLFKRNGQTVDEADGWIIIDR